MSAAPAPGPGARGDNDCRGLKIDGHHACVRAKRRRKEPRSERCHQAIGPGHACAQANQGEHIQVHGFDGGVRRARRMASLPTAPPALLGDQLKPMWPAVATTYERAAPTICPMASSDPQAGSARRDPEAPGHILGLDPPSLCRRDNRGFERHAALGTDAGRPGMTSGCIGQV